MREDFLLSVYKSNTQLINIGYNINKELILYSFFMLFIKIRCYKMRVMVDGFKSWRRDS